MFDTRYKNNHDSKIPNKNDRYAILRQLKNEHEFLKLTDSTSLQVTVDNLIYDILRFKDIIPNKISIIKKLNFNDLQKVISSINLDNSSVVYMNPKNN